LCEKKAEFKRGAASPVAAFVAAVKHMARNIHERTVSKFTSADATEE